MNRKPTKILRENKQFTRKLIESQFDGIEDPSDFTELYDDEEDWFESTSEDDDWFEADETVDPYDYLNDEEEKDNFHHMYMDSNNRLRIEGDEDDSEALFEKIYTKSNSTKLKEGGPRKNMSQETINAFVHQLLLIPEPARRQEVVDEIFQKIAEENQKAYEKSQSKLNKTEKEVKEDLKESHLKEMVTECQLCGKVFDSHEEGHIIDDGVLVDVPVCDKCYDRYTDYN